MSEYSKWSQTNNSGFTLIELLVVIALGIADVETSEGTHPKSPDFDCGTMTWNEKFEWFTGGFEK